MAEKLNTYNITKGPILIIDRDEIGRHLQARHTIMLDTIRQSQLPVSGVELDEILSKIDRFILLFENTDLLDKFQFYSKYRKCLKYVEDFETLENFVYHQLMRLSRATDRALQVNSELRAVLVEELKFQGFSDDLLDKLMVTSNVISYDFVDDDHYWSITDFDIDVNKKVTFNVNKTPKPFTSSMQSHQFRDWLFAENLSIQLLSRISENERILKAISHWFLLHQELNVIKEATGKYFEMFMFDNTGRLDFTKASGAVNLFLRQAPKSGQKPTKYIEFATYSLTGGRKSKFATHTVPYLDFWSSLNVKFNNTYNLAMLDEFKHDINLYARYKRSDLTKEVIQDQEAISELFNSILRGISTMDKREVLEVMKLIEVKLCDTEDPSVVQRRQLNIDNLISDLAKNNPKQSNEAATVAGEMIDPDKPKEFVMPHSVYQDDYLPVSKAGDYSDEAAEQFENREILHEFKRRRLETKLITEGKEKYKDDPDLKEVYDLKWKYFLESIEEFDSTKARQILVPFNSLEYRILELKDTMLFQKQSPEVQEERINKIIDEWVNRDKLSKEKAAMLNGDHLVTERNVHEVYTQELFDNDKTKKISQNEQLERRVKYMLKQKADELAVKENAERNELLNANLQENIEPIQVSTDIFTNDVSETLALAPKYEFEKSSFEKCLNSGPMGVITSEKPQSIESSVDRLWQINEKQVNVPVDMPENIEIDFEEVQNFKTLLKPTETPLISYDLLPITPNFINVREIKKQIRDKIDARHPMYLEKHKMTPYNYVLYVHEMLANLQAKSDFDELAYCLARLRTIFPDEPSLERSMYWSTDDLNKLQSSLLSEYRRIQNGDIVDFRTLKPDQQIVLFSNEFYEIRILRNNIATYFKDNSGKLTSFGAYGTPHSQLVRGEYQKFIKLMGENLQVMHWQLQGEYPVPILVPSDTICHTIQSFEHWASDNLIDVTDENKDELFIEYQKSLVSLVGEHFRRISPDVYGRINTVQRDNTYRWIINKFVINSKIFKWFTTEGIEKFKKFDLEFTKDDALQISLLTYLLQNGFGVSVYERMLWVAQLQKYSEYFKTKNTRIAPEFDILEDQKALEKLIYCTGFEVVSKEVLYNNWGETPWKMNVNKIGKQCHDNLEDRVFEQLEFTKDLAKFDGLKDELDLTYVDAIIQKSMFRTDIDNSEISEQQLKYWIENLRLPGFHDPYYKVEQIHWKLNGGK